MTITRSIAAVVQLTQGEPQMGAISESCFQVNTPSVTHETIDGETVIINLQSGNYYSLNGVGSEIWSLLDKRVSATSIIDWCADQYKAERSVVEQIVLGLVQRMQDEELIVQLPVHLRGEIPSPQLIGVTEYERPHFEVPQLQKFTDMQELLWLDPIHEVGEDGWPHRNTKI